MTQLEYKVITVADLRILKKVVNIVLGKVTF